MLYKIKNLKLSSSEHCLATTFNKKMKKTILLGWLPPAMENMPSPCLSVLKPALNQLGYDVSLKYWNISLNPLLKSFFNMENLIYDTELNKLMPFLLNLGISLNDTKIVDKIKYYIYSIKPQLHSKGNEYIYEYFHSFNEKLNCWFEHEINQIKFDDYLFVGFSAQFYQWLVANLFIDKIKSAYPNTHILVGGFGTKEEAVTFLRNFPNVDYTSWGEGEYSIQQLALYLDGEKVTLSSIPNTVYRIGNNTKVNLLRNVYTDLNKSTMDFSDYFSIIQNFSLDQELSLPIEGGRGCSWRQCRFCFLNTGYKYRTKSNEQIIREIKEQIERYGVNRILFLDNDVIGSDMDNFIDLLDMLIEYRKENNNFSILLAEIVTKGLPFSVVKKMALAGFESVQIGYESPSNNLLEKIHKKNTFASNLFFIKWANELGIRINGANVLRNLLEETTDDIKESIDNLYFLRFYFQKKLVCHSYSFLSVAKSSPYYRTLLKTNRLIEWRQSHLAQFTPDSYMSLEDKFILFFDFIKPEYNHLWDTFQQIEQHYINNIYDYQLIVEKDSVFYREFYNNTLIKEIEFEIDDIYWQVLQLCNYEVLSVDQITNKLSNKKSKGGETLSEVILNLEKEGLLYCNDSQTEIVTVLDIHKTIILGQYGANLNSSILMSHGDHNALLVS